MKQILTDHELGYTDTNLRQNLTTQEYNRFVLWMRGQTCAVDKGELVYYAGDFQRWLRAKPIID